MPMTTPARSAHGAVPNLRSIQYPTSANPAVAPASSKPAPEYLTQPGNRRPSGTVPMLCEMIHAIRAFLKRPGCACEHFFRFTGAYWGPSAGASSRRSRLFFSFHSKLRRPFPTLKYTGRILATQTDCPSGRVLTDTRFRFTNMEPRNGCRRQKLGDGLYVTERAITCVGNGPMRPRS